MRPTPAVATLRLLAAASLLFLPLSTPGGAAEPATEQAPAAPEAFVRLRDHRLFAIRVARSGQSAEQRARDATRALASALEAHGPVVVRVEEAGDVATLFAGATPVLQLGPADAAAAGDATLSVHAAAAAATIEQAVRAEQRRERAQQIVLNISLAVFVGLLAFLAIRKLGDLEGGVERWLDGRPQGAAAVRLGNVELASERTVRGGLHVFLRFAKRLLQVLIAYLWLLFVLSLFPATRAAGSHITEMMLEPLGRLLARLVGAIPQILAVAVLGVLVYVLLRSVQLFFGSVARGETHLAWVPAELARPTSTLLQAVLLIVTLVVLGPVITGDESGPFQAVARAVLIAVGIACAPLFAAVIAGLPVVYGRSLRVGEVADLAGQVGVVKEIDLLSVVLEDAEGRPVRIPHLVSLFKPMRVLGPTPLVTLEVTVAASEDQPRVQALLAQAAGSHASGARVELRSLDSRGALYRITSGYDDAGPRLLSALKDAGIALAALGEAGARR
jgi:small-conductance mechanosensitive channel